MQFFRARGDKAALGGSEKIKLSNLRAEFSTFNTGGTLITTPDNADPNDKWISKSTRF